MWVVPVVPRPRGGFFFGSFNPAFSPSVRSIAFSTDFGGSETDLFTMRADGTQIRRLTDGDPTWQPLPR